jgi:hypothetical protein
MRKTTQIRVYFLWEENMHVNKIRWVLFGFLAVFNFYFVACIGNSEKTGGTGGEVTEKAGLKVDESLMISSIRGSNLDLNIVLQRTVPSNFRGIMTVILEDLEGNVIDTVAKMFEISKQEQTLPVTLFGIPEYEFLEDLGEFVINYRLAWNSNVIFGKRSVYATLPKLEAQVLAPSRLYENSGSFLRTLVRDPVTGKAKENIRVTVELQQDEVITILGEGHTDENGTAEILLQVPNGVLGTGKMVVSIDNSEGSSESVSGSVEVMREEKILLTTDKPMYQPGQLIHMRLLALRRPDLNPAGNEELLFEVRDGKGNKVFKHTGTTDEFGIGSAEFRLASEVNMGDYEIFAKVGTTETTKTVDVKRYALPKFGVEFSTDRGYYLPGERVTGEVNARYFFGQPVSGGSVIIKVFTFDVGLVEIGEVAGQLNGEGIFGFQYDLPTAFAGIDLLQGDAYLQFDVEVQDLAEHKEKKSVVSVVASSPLKVSLVPESGDLVPGVLNIVHVVTADPRGLPVPASVEITSADMPMVTLSTDERGLGIAAVLPMTDNLVLHVKASDQQGNQLEKDIEFTVGQSGSVVLLRVDKRLYKVGDTIHLEIFANDTQDRIYLDAIKNNQTLLTHALDLIDGKAIYEMELTPDMEGNVQFDAYYLTRKSQIVRDSQLVLVEGARDLSVQVSLDKDSYLPAETATVSFDVKNSDGQGVAAAIGLAIVDEAVFALTEFRPGLAETFFEIEQEILKPRYQIVSSSSLGGYLDDSLPPEQREASAAVTFAAARGFSGYGIEQNTYVNAAGRIVEIVSARLDADATEILNQMQYYASMGFVTFENLEQWLTANNQWYDPFGQPYSYEIKGTSTWDQTLTIKSAGADELVGSPDDSASRAFYTYYVFDYYRDGWGPDFGGPNEDFDMTGNMDPGAQPPHQKDCPECEGDGSEGGENAAPRLRSYFPETLYVNPALITDASGQATVEIPMADSITTWRMASMASSMNGSIGSRSDGILVFQDFFIDVDFPATLTLGDEVSVPVAVYNYMDIAQSVTLSVEPESWFSLIGPSSKNISLDAGEVSVVYFDVAILEVGWHGFSVLGYGCAQSDAVRRTVEIVPNGKEFRDSVSDRLGPQATRTISIPEEAIDGASRIFVKVYPGLMSQAVEGLDALLKIPNGCFEQTTTTAWPNIMVLNYLKNSGQLTPEIELKARDYVNQSYQRIVTFECPSGGFNWWVGDDPGNDILTAMALMMFADAKDSVDIDMNVVQRSEDTLVANQNADGSWSGESHLHAGFEIYGESQLRASAFCTWGLAMSPYDGAAVDLGVSYIKSALPGSDDLYTRALSACALAWNDPNDSSLQSLLAEFENAKSTGDNGVVFWDANTATASGACGNNGNMETTALIVQAMIKAGAYPDTVNGAITWLIQQKNSLGLWGSTQGTVQSLRAMSMAMDFAASQDVSGTASVSINGATDVCTFDITPDNSDVTRICELNNFTAEGDNTVTVSLNGEGTFLYQVVGVYYLPWDMVSDSPDGPLSIDVSYDRTNLAVDETVEVSVTVSYNVPGEKASMIMVDMGIPPGFDLVTEDLAGLVESQPRITRFEIRGRQLSIYLDELANGSPVSFSYRMKAKYPINCSTPESTVWAYYNPEMRAVSKPVSVAVVRQ